MLYRLREPEVIIIIIMKFIMRTYPKECKVQGAGNWGVGKNRTELLHEARFKHKGTQTQTSHNEDTRENGGK